MDNSRVDPSSEDDPYDVISITPSEDEYELKSLGRPQLILSINPTAAAVVVVAKEKEEERVASPDVDYSQWHESYKTVMGNALRYMIRLSQASPSKWRLQEYIIEGFDPITLSEYDGGGEGRFVLKATGVLSGSARRYSWAMRDYNADTRLAWENSGIITSVNERQSFVSSEGKLHYVEMGVNIGSYPRWSRGLIHARYDKSANEYRVAYASADHPEFIIPEGKVVLNERWALFAHDIQKKPTKSSVTIIHELDSRAPGVKEWFRTTQTRQVFCEMIRTRMYALENAVTNWDHYYGPTRDPKKLENRK
jgi:hypothetical protein